MIETGTRTSLWRVPVMRAFVALTLLGFASYYVTLASLPAYAVAGGADQNSAGIVTTVFLCVTIAGQLAVPALTARFGLGPVLVAGLLALGAPAPLYALDDGLAWLTGLAVVRGAGFAVLTVLTATLAAFLVPPERRGESIGLYGLATAVPNLVAVPAGAALVLAGHPGWLAWLAATPVLAVPLVPRLLRAAPAAAAPAGAGYSARAARAALPAAAVLFVATFAGGALVTFLPIERPDGALVTGALLAFGVTGALTRWGAGLLADRVGDRLLLPGAAGAGALGLVLVGLGLEVGPALVLVGAAVFGIGFGSAQNLTLLAAFRRAGDSGASTASAMWNSSFDAGTAVGALLPGLAVALVGLPWTYAVVAVVLLLVIPVARAAGRRA